MNALVLVGGMGTRLRPLTNDIPKPMLPIIERPMIFEIVEWLGRYGVSKVVFALGHQSDVFSAAFADGIWAGIEIVTATEPEPRDTAGAIAFAADVAGVSGKRLLVVNGDILTDLDLSELIAFHEAHGKSATIALTAVKDPSAFGVVPTDEAGRVLAFIEKPKIEEAPTNLINAGTYVLEPSVLALIRRDGRVSIEREIFPELVEMGDLFAMSSSSYWLDTGTPERYLQAQHDVLAGLRSQVVLPECIELTPGVHVAVDASCDGTVIGPSFIASRAMIAPSAFIEHSVIGRDVQVEADARVIGSMVLPGAMIGVNVSLSDCIVGPGAVVGEGAQLCNSIIGASCVVAPNVQLYDERMPA